MTGDAAPLTSRQRAILAAIGDFSRDRGYPPSMREIGDAVGLNSTSTVSRQLGILQRKGYVDWTPGKQRAVVIRKPGRDIRTLAEVQESIASKLRLAEVAGDRDAAMAEAARLRDVLAAVGSACRDHLGFEGSCCPHFATEVLEIIEGGGNG